MKALLFTVATLFSITAMADQCSYVSADVAQKAAFLLQPGATVANFCELCGDTKAASYAVESVEVKKIDNQYSQVVVNGKDVDLAYLYLKVAPAKKVNLALALGCDTLDESTVSSVIK